MTKLILHLAISLCLASLMSAQYTPPGGGGSGSGDVSKSGTPSSLQQAQWTDSSHIKGVAQGTFNVRLMYGAVPNGSTDNSTAIAAAFTASNAYTLGIPTVYFDCDTSATVCEYNYGGSGTSPIAPTVPTTILCAPGVYLNYTGSAHAADIGQTGLTAPDGRPYTIEGCTFTGAASSTHGIYFNLYAMQTRIINNFFFKFGNRTGANIKYTGGNWKSVVQGNQWWDNDGVTRNILDSHDGSNTDIQFIGNTIECETSGGTACSVSTIGYGLWLAGTPTIIGNAIQFHQPLIRLADSGAASWNISNNKFEGNTDMPGPAISYGNPGGTGAHIGGLTLTNNYFYWPGVTGTSLIGPETAGTGSYQLQNALIVNNYFTFTPIGGGVYVQTNSDSGNLSTGNRDGAQALISRGHSPTMFDSDSANKFTPVTSTDVAGSFSGCSGTKYLGADGACHPSVLSCQAGLGDGTNAITAATYLQSTCYNDTGATVTISGIKCFTDNSGTSTLAVTNGAGTALLTGDVTCSSTFAAGTQSATVTIASADVLKFTFVADGTSKQTTWVVTEGF